MMIVARGGDYLCGRIAPAMAVGVLLPLVVLCFVVSAGLALAFFPTVYDLRYRWVSSLASARHNPLGYFYFGAGLAAVSVLLIPIPGYLSGWSSWTSRAVRRTGLFALWTGVVGLFLLAVETTVFPNYGRGRDIHRILSMIALSGLTLGFLCFGGLSIFRAAATRSNLWPASLACSVLSAPPLGVGLTHILMEFGSDGLGWATSRAAKHAAPFFRTLAFWEWAAVVCLLAGGYLTVLAASLQHTVYLHTEERDRLAD